MIATTIADAAHRCLASFDAISQVSVSHALGSPPSDDGRSRYNIWASNLGSLHPGADRRSADYRLREAPEVVERIVELLEELTEINSDILEILSGARTNRQISETEDNSESSDELSELNLSVGDIITSLFKVSMLVKKATTRDRYAKAASAKEAAFLAEFDIRHVADKYPKLRTQPWLLERLGNAITQRRQFLRYCRNHKHRIAHVAPQETVPNELLPRPAHTNAKLDISAHTVNATSTTNTPLTRPTLTPTTASTLHADRISPEDLQDLDHDDAVSQATSVAYSQMDPDDPGILHVPRLEDVSHGLQPGQPFECPFCFGIVQARRQHSWRKHVLSDLRAYVCLSAECDVGLFEDKAAWQAHDAECHQRQWSCNQCRSGPFTSAKDLQHHLHLTHEIGKLPDNVVTKIVDASSHPVSEAAPNCPFCDFEDKVRNDATARGQDLLPNAQVAIPLAEYHRHLAFHQEQLALFAIPPEAERSVESGSNHGRSKADPEEGIQFMTRWQNLLDITDIADSLEDAQDVVATDDLTLEESVSSNNIPSSKPNDLGLTQAPAMGDPSIYMPAEGLFPSILPGDIVYIPQEDNEQLWYKKGVYLGRNKDNKHTARDWYSKSEVEVSLATLVRKTDYDIEEKQEATSLRTYQPPEGVEFHPRQYRKNHILSSQACDNLLFEASQLAHGEKEIIGYDEGFVKPIFSNFSQRFSERDVTNGVRLKDIVRMFYATATSEQSKDATSSDAMWKADAERSAALLMKVLIEIVEDQYNYDENLVAQLRSEQAQMIIRANEAVKLASGSYFRQSFTDRQSTFDDADGNHLEIDFPTLKALKIRLQSVATGQEQLPGFGDDDVKRTFKTFSRFMEALPVAGTSLVEDIVRDFRRCAIHETNADNTLDRDQRNVIVRRQEALLLSLLISVDARVQFELHGSAPRIRSRFTTILMEERARLSFSASRSEALSNPHGYAALTEEPETSHSDALHTKEVVDPVERPPRELRCHSCQHTWISISGAELRDCPKCGSYSVFAESPRRTASPDPGVPHRASATGEEALGQYFSERTDKYMNLYRQQPLPKSTSDSHESLPNPWEHLHTSSNTSLAKASRMPPQEVQRAQTERSTAELSLEDSPTMTAAQWEGMQEVLRHICDYKDGNGSTPSKWFHHKANKQIIPEYYDIIKEPMTLSMIKQKIDTRAYQSVREFVRDFVLISFNAQAFNRPDSSAYRDALIVERELKDQLRRLVESGVIEEEDLILPDLGSILDYDDLPDRSYGFDGPRSESLLAMDASMRSLREWQNNAGNPLQSSSDTSQEKANRTLTEQPTTQVKSQEAAGAAATLVALQDRLASYDQDKNPESEPDTASVIPESEKPDAANTGSLPMICYTCRHRFAHLANEDGGECPKCGSEAVVANLPQNTASSMAAAETAETREPSARLHHLGIEPSKLLDLIIDIRNTTAILQLLQEQHSRNQRDLPEAVDQLLSLGDGFKRLAELQEKPEYQLRFQRVQKNVHVLCSSVRYTIATVMNTLHFPLHETQWMALTSSMRNIEHADIQERLRWYQAAIAGLLDHMDGFTSESLLGMDPNIRSLLDRQRSAEKSGDCTTLINASGGDQRGSPPETSMSKSEAEQANPATSSESPDPTQPGTQASDTQIQTPLNRLIADTELTLTILRPLRKYRHRDASILPEITEDLQSLLGSFQKLSQLHDDPEYEPKFVKAQEHIQMLCRSMQYTLDAGLEVLTKEPQSDETQFDEMQFDETQWMRLAMLTTRLSEEEKVGLPERLRWYSGCVMGLLNHLDGFSSSGRIFQGLGMEEKVRNLLKRQESSRG